MSALASSGWEQSSKFQHPSSAESSKLQHPSSNETAITRQQGGISRAWILLLHWRLDVGA
jgi:hypothetical protein